MYTVGSESKAREPATRRQLAQDNTYRLSNTANSSPTTPRESAAALIDRRAANVNILAYA